LVTSVETKSGQIFPKPNVELGRMVPYNVLTYEKCTESIKTDKPLTVQRRNAFAGAVVVSYVLSSSVSNSAGVEVRVSESDLKKSSTGVWRDKNFFLFCSISS
jgi:hypothetical protein